MATQTLQVIDRRKKKEDKDKKEPNKFEKYKECICTLFIAELIFFLYKVAVSMLEPTTRLYIYHAVCLNIFPNKTLHTCSNLASNQQHEEEVQRISGQYIYYYKILLNGPAIFLGLFCGAWSDIVGRKLPIMLPCLGTILAVLMYMVSLQYVIPPLWMILVGTAINGAFGKSAVISMALHSYAADISDKDSRTQKLGKLLSMNFFGYFIGSLISGALLDAFTFDVIFVVVVAILSIVVLITLAFMKEPSLHELSSNDENDTVKSPIKSLFRTENIRESLKIFTKEREDRDRLHLIYFFLFIITFQTCKSGELDVLQLFVQRTPLSWPDYMYGFLLATDYACLGIAVILLLPLLVNYAHLNDVLLVLLAMIFKTIRLVTLSYSDHTWMVFFSVVIGAPSAMLMSGLKSLISKTVDEDELGKAFSLLSSGETIASMIGSITFISVYNATSAVFPGMVFGIDAVFFIILFILFMFVSYSVKITESFKFLRDIAAQRKEDESKKQHHLKFAEVFEDPSSIQRIESALSTVLEDGSEQSSKLRELPETVNETKSTTNETNTGSADNDVTAPTGTGTGINNNEMDSIQPVIFIDEPTSDSDY